MGSRFAQTLSVASIIAAVTIGSLKLPNLPTQSVIFADTTGHASGTPGILVKQSGTSTAFSIETSFVFPVSATSTVATSTILNVNVARYMIKSNSSGNTTPTQILPLPSDALYDGQEIQFMGTDDTATVTIADSANFHMTSDADCTLGDGDAVKIKYSYWRSYWYQVEPCSDN